MTSLSPPLQAVVALFRGPLAHVRFGDIDGAGLSSLAAEVEAAATEVEQQETKLAETKQQLAQKQEALLVLAQQALAYARIYAENDDVLSAELNDIALPRATKPKKPAAPKPAKAAEESAPVVEEAAPLAEAAERVQESEEVAEESAEKQPVQRRKVQRKLARPAARDAV